MKISKDLIVRNMITTREGKKPRLCWRKITSSTPILNVFGLILPKKQIEWSRQAKITSFESLIRKMAEC